eukprot:154979-Prymnesium_polylepis.1
MSDHVLGRGAWGVVSKGTLKRPTSTEIVAVKALPEMTSQDERRVLEREIEMLVVATKNCRYVSVLYGTSFLASRLCIVMKLCEPNATRPREPAHQSRA